MEGRCAAGSEDRVEEGGVKWEGKREGELHKECGGEKCKVCLCVCCAVISLSPPLSSPLSLPPTVPPFLPYLSYMQVIDFEISVCVFVCV